MSMIQSDLLLGQEGGAGYAISRSLRFNSSDSAYCSRVFSSAGSRTAWTWSGWAKKAVNNTSDDQCLFGGYSAANDTDWLEFGFGGSNDHSPADKIYWTTNNTTSGTTALYRDSSAWYHIVASYDGANLKFYVNTELVLTSAKTGNLGINVAGDHAIGKSPRSSVGRYFNGYLADIHFIDGQALTPSSFTEVSATTGQLIPKAYTGSFGTNGFWLKFSDNSAATATTLGKDYSGNSNNWTPNNLSVTAGAGNDSLVDTPTSYGTDTGTGGEVRGNYCTLNPLGTAGAAPTNGNLSVSSSSTVGNRISTFFLTNGKWYWEGSGNGYVGAIVGRGGESFTGSISGTGSKAIGWWEGGPVYWDGGDNGGSTTFTSTDVIGIALDMDAGNIKFYKNNSLIYTITFGSGTVPNLSSGVFPAYNVGASTKSVDLNFGQRPFAYTAPSGFKALCDTNLPAPVVAKGSSAMDVLTWTGNSASSRALTGLGFSPDFVWIKDRSNGYNHVLFDAVRGAGGSKVLFSNRTTAEGGGAGEEGTNYGAITSFDSSGFTVAPGAVNSVWVNQSSDAYVAWAWDAGSSTVTNTQGSITSQVRANASAGFSIVTYTGTGSAATVGHGLGVAPSLVLVKIRSQTGNWQGYHASLGKNYTIKLNTTEAQENIADYWGAGGVTSSVVGLIGGGYTTNVNGATHVAYCFAPVAGYSSFGSITGNGSADGPFVFCGFRPRFLLIKVYSGDTGAWRIYDSSRNTYNVVDLELNPNSGGAEYTASNTVDFTSNGFKIRTSNINVNLNTAGFIYFAVAENPFQYARAR